MLIARLHGLSQGKLLRAKALHLQIFRFIEARESHKGKRLGPPQSLRVCGPCSWLLVFSLFYRCKGETNRWECSFTVGEVIEEFSVDEYMKVIGVYENLGPITAEERRSKVKELPTERKHAMIHRRGSANQVVNLLDILKRQVLAVPSFLCLGKKLYRLFCF